jgi:hypothetical protein
MTDTGRGAWSLAGKDNGEVYYRFVKGQPLDGSTPEKGIAYECVHHGVNAIQERLFELGYADKLNKPFNIENVGRFSKQTKRMVILYQKENFPATLWSGLVGSTTAKNLFGQYIKEINPAHAHLLFGIAMAESGFDPGAQGYFTPWDIGLFQINTLVHTDFDIAKACDYRESTAWVSTRFERAWDKYKGKGEELRLNCSIAQHNAPTWADDWFVAGSPPNEKIADYVQKIKGFADEYSALYW